tara:strand:- start:817 stop:948 length:132 start_codon:yes stop_codon:yes gene_type:complete
MKAIIQKEYGGVDKLTLEEVEKPLIQRIKYLLKFILQMFQLEI